MPSPDHVQFVERLVAAANSGDLERWASFYSLDVANHGRPVGRDGMRRIFGALYELFPDWRFDVSEILSDDQDVVVLMRMTGTHRGTSRVPVVGGALVGLPPTGRTVTIDHIHRYRVVDGLIQDHRAVRDDLGMMQQLGLVAATDPASDISRPER